MATDNDLLIPGLPNDMAMLCIARVPRSDHGDIVGVCQSWRNFLHGSIYWEVRRKLSMAEEWLHLWVEPENVWCRFDPFLKKLIAVPKVPFDNMNVGLEQAAFASLHGKVFVIGGSYSTDEFSVACKTVTCFDLRSYSWEKLADLNVGRAYCKVGVIEDRLYVFGGFPDGNRRLTPLTSAETYDAHTDTWKFISDTKFPLEMGDSFVMNGKFYASHPQREVNGIVYNPQTNAWEDLTDGLSDCWESKTAILDGKLYTVEDAFVAGIEGDVYDSDSEQVIRVYKPSKDEWKIVKEVWNVRVPISVMTDVDFVSFGGKLSIVSAYRSGVVECDEADEGDEYDEGEEVFLVKIFMMLLEVGKSTRNPKFRVTFRGEFEIPLEEAQCAGWAGIRCLVITL